MTRQTLSNVFYILFHNKPETEIETISTRVSREQFVITQLDHCSTLVVTLVVYVHVLWYCLHFY